MKNLVLSALLLMSTLAIAQPGERGRKMPSPEIQAKNMTLALDLSDKQEKEVFQLLTDQKSKMEKTKVSKEERRDLTSEQKNIQRTNMLDQKIAMKREFKKILSEDQYERWEKMVAKRAGKRRAGKKRK
jgi:hypothetical protein